jgi:hypothetical protein
MIHVVVGNKKERQNHIAELYKQYGFERGQVQHLYDNDVKASSFHDMVPVDTGLFGEAECYVVHNCIRDLDIQTIFELYKGTEHQIIFSEDTILKKVRTTAEKYGIEITEFEKEKKESKKTFNIFALADALGNRNKKQLWLLFREAIVNASPEEIHGILFWQMKNLALVKTSTTNPGMNGFVYTKNKTFAENFSKMDLLTINARLVRMFHERDSHSTLEIELEKMILAL